MQVLYKSLSKKELNSQVDEVLIKIINRAKDHPLGVYSFATQLAIETDQKITHIKELKQQIASCRCSMTEMFGEEIITEIDRLDIKFRKLKRLSILKNQPKTVEF